jgi:hypothetical protein
MKAERIRNLLPQDVRGLETGVQEPRLMLVKNEKWGIDAAEWGPRERPLWIDHGTAENGEAVEGRN